MQRRARKSHRVLALQQQLNRIEQWKLAELQRRLAGLETEQRELIGALNEDHALHGLFIDTMARRLSSLAEEAVVVGRDKDAQSVRAVEHSAKVKLAERLAEARDLDVQRADDRRQLLDMIEQFLRRPRTTSLP